MHMGNLEGKALCVLFLFRQIVRLLFQPTQQILMKKDSSRKRYVLFN